MPRAVRNVVTAAVIAAAGAMPAALLYRHTIAYGFDYDDYHFVRPFTGAEIAAAFHGPWDASGIELPYYRPLTIVLYAIRFAAFGFNSEAYHLASVAAFALAAVLAGFVAWSLTGRRDAGAVTALAFAVHPAMPYALVSWVTNQMHLLELLLVLSALAWWSVVRNRPFAWWVPLWIVGIGAFLTKEDGIMLLPVIVVLHWLRRRIAEPDLRRPPVPFVVGSVVLVAVLLWVRSEVLAHAAGRVMPGFRQGLENYAAGLRVFRLVPARRPWQLAASWFVTVVALGGIAALRRTSPGIRFGIAAGALIAAAFNLPFVLVTKSEQLHVVATGAALVLGISAVAVLDALRWRAAKCAAAVAMAGGFCACAAVSLNISSDFRPFGPIVLSHDRIVRTWAAVPEEIRAYLERKRSPDAPGSLSPNPAVAVDAIVFGVHPEEVSPAGVRYRWMSAAATDIFVAQDARAITIPLRHEIGAFREPTVATVTVDGAVMDRIELGDGEWRFSRSALSRTTVPTLQRMHHVVVSIDHPWVPSAVIPGSGDSRPLGLQIGSIELR